MNLKKRLFKLSPHVVRMLIPKEIIGSYILYKLEDNKIIPEYIGRSDFDLRNRLIRHALNNKAQYFEYMVLDSREKAFNLECSLFHALSGEISNKIHPDNPNNIRISCPICKGIKSIKS